MNNYKVHYQLLIELINKIAYRENELINELKGAHFCDEIALEFDNYWSVIKNEYNNPIIKMKILEIDNIFNVYSENKDEQFWDTYKIPEHKDWDKIKVLSREIIEEINKKPAQQAGGADL